MMEETQKTVIVCVQSRPSTCVVSMKHTKKKKLHYVLSPYSTAVWFLCNILLTGEGSYVSALE